MNLLKKIKAWWSGENVAEEFRVRFPGKCILCSFHRHAEAMGADLGKIRQHERIERSQPEESK